MRSGSAHCDGELAGAHCDLELAEEKEKEGEMVRALIKSNNPFVAGGEKWL